MRILVSNDDGYKAPGLIALVETLKEYGDVTVVGPKYPQSGTSMAVTMGLKPIAVKKLSESKHESWYYLDGTPASCIKYGLDNIFTEARPDLVVSGINLGANNASASLYSGTLGAAREGALAGVPAIAVSVDSYDAKLDYSHVKEALRKTLDRLLPDMSGKFGTVYNINIPAIPFSEIKGIRTTHQGIVHWIDEFEPYSTDIYSRKGVTPAEMGIMQIPDLEPGEQVYLMVGQLTDDPRNGKGADHHVIQEGYITVTIHNIDSTDYDELERVRKTGTLDTDF